MDRHLIFEGNNSQITSFQFLDLAPEAKAIVLLRLNPDRIGENTLAPVSFQVWPFPENFILKVFGISVLAHTDPNILQLRVLVCRPRRMEYPSEQAA